MYVLSFDLQDSYFTTTTTTTQRAARVVSTYICLISPASALLRIHLWTGVGLNRGARPHPTLHLLVRRCVVQDAARKGQRRRKRCSEAIDKRMSTIPTDWESISATGAQAAIRNSIAVSGVGAATFFSALTPFGLLASTLRMTMTQGTRGPIDVLCLLSGSGTLFSSPFTSRP